MRRTRSVFNGLGRPVKRFEVQPGTPVPSLPYSWSLRLDVRVPGIVGVPIKVIVVHGELRERISEVSGRWGMGLGSGS